MYRNVRDAAMAVGERATTPEQIAFARHLEKVAVALHDLEWVWSGDKSEGEEVTAIQQCVSPVMVKNAAAIRTELLAKEMIGVLDAFLYGE